MSLETASVVAAWEAPSWAESHVIDEQAVVHSRAVGAFRRVGLGAAVDNEREVLVVQRDEFDEIDDVGSITRNPAYLLFDGNMIAVKEASELARLLLAGVAMVEGSQACRAASTSREVRSTRGPLYGG